MTWSFNSITLFFNSSPLELQEVVPQWGHTLTDLSTLTLSFSQEREFQNIRKHSVVVYKTLMDENRRIRKIMTNFSHGRNSHANNLVIDADCHFLLLIFLVKIELSWRVKTENFTYTTQPTNIFASFLMGSMIVLGLAPPNIYSNFVLVRRIKPYEICFSRNFGITFLPLGRYRSLLLVYYLTIAPNLVRPLLFRKFLGLLQVRNPKLTFLGQLRFHNPKLSKMYAKYHDLWYFSLVSLTFPLILRIPCLSLLIPFFLQLIFI